MSPEHKLRLKKELSNLVNLGKEKVMASKLSKLRKGGMPTEEFSPEVEADLEEPMEDEEELGVEEESPLEEEPEMAEKPAASVEEVMDMLQSLTPEELDEVAMEIESLQAIGGMPEEEFEGEDFEMEDEGEEMPEEEE